MDIKPDIDGAASFGAAALKSKYKPTRWILTALREQPSETDNPKCDTPERAAAYWRENIATTPGFNPEVETLYVLLLNTPRRIKGHVLVATGTMDTLLVHPREVFRIAIIGSAAAIILMHNHPGDDPKPSEGDIKVTRDLIRAGQILKIEVLDHVVIGKPNHASMRELGCFYTS